MRKFFEGVAKFFVSLILLPVLLGLAAGFFKLFRNPPGMSAAEIFFVFGFFIFIVLFLLKILPGYVYVFGHESTHAVWALLFRGKVTEFNVARDHGNVVTTKSNCFIVLAPYFFPFYTFLIILVYYCLAFFFDIARWVDWLFFLVGFTYSFHIFLTVDAVSDGQSDIQKTGYFFSLVLIMALNIVTAVLILKFVTPEKISLKGYFADSAGIALAIYRFVFIHLRDWLILLFRSIFEKQPQQ